MNPIRILIIDDSALVRRLLTSMLEDVPNMEVVGAAADAYAGRDLLVTLRPDVVLLDIHMPRMDGISFLRRYMDVYPTATIILSAAAGARSPIVLEALKAGAVDVMEKPALNVIQNSTPLREDLLRRIRSAAHASLPSSSTRATMSVRPNRLGSAATIPSAIEHGSGLRPSQIVVVIGASTGGVAALATVLSSLPAQFPGIVIVQHMPEGTTTSLAASLNDSSPMKVREACIGDVVHDGVALLAPANGRHTVLAMRTGNFCIGFDDTEPRHHQRPAVDNLFESAALCAGPQCIATLLTGMGRDGAQGLLAIRNAGGRTIAQDSESSVVNGMPEAAWQLGAAEHRASIDDMSKQLILLVADVASRHSHTRRSSPASEPQQVRREN